MGRTDIRPAGLIRREIADLREYLDGVPEPLRASGALQAYEIRLAEHQNELLVSSLVESLPQAAPERASALTPLGPPTAMDTLLGAAQHRLERRLKSQARLRAALNIAGLLASAASGFLAYFLPRANVPLSAVVAAAALAFATMLVSALYARVDTALEYQRAIDRLRNVRTYLAASADAEPDAALRARYANFILAEMDVDASDPPAGQAAFAPARVRVP